ncbi:hypothetical protein KP509_06G038400 [Ceratopteris richardii]|uniref:SLL1 protein n=1 Tax=Ceratopteris richardii TaxID=49495 RepID=A0A8T2UH93_CERRI|nr:hypothetical protein KP509_06G038400 [Ceratopteris richardii]
MAAAIVRGVSKRLTSVCSTSVKRVQDVKPLHSSTAKQSGGVQESHAHHDNHGHHEDDYGAYVHAKRMYDLPNMKHRTLKMGLGVFGVVFIGTAVPIFAVMFQQKKAMIS